jgi:hypothetical protein
MLWWHWLVVGLILVALEMAASGGFYVIFFGIAALALAGLHVLDWAGPVWLQLVLFSGISVVSLLFFRGPLLTWMQLGGPGKDVDSLVETSLCPSRTFPPAPSDAPNCEARCGRRATRVPRRSPAVSGARSSMWIG